MTNMKWVHSHLGNFIKSNVNQFAKFLWYVTYKYSTIFEFIDRNICVPSYSRAFYSELEGYFNKQWLSNNGTIIKLVNERVIPLNLREMVGIIKKKFRGKI